ncbi:MAG: signal peptidase II [Bacilli bacterium]|nr:signal peptidase II [Bacilli bacterium]
MSTLPESNETLVENKELSTKEKIFNYLKWFFKSFIWVAILCVVIDVISKVLCMKYLPEGDSVQFIPGLLKFTLVFNKGAAWSIGGGADWSRILLCVISWAAAVGIIVYFILKYKTLNLLSKFTLMLVLGGDVGNLIDRTFFYNRGVCDFFDITEFIPGFGIFNVADSFLVVGVILFIVIIFIDMIKENLKGKNSGK